MNQLQAGSGHGLQQHIQDAAVGKECPCSREPENGFQFKKQLAFVAIILNVAGSYSMILIS